jgi:hypothetical protein
MHSVQNDINKLRRHEARQLPRGNIHLLSVSEEGPGLDSEGTLTVHFAISPVERTEKTYTIDMYIND